MLRETEQSGHLNVRTVLRHYVPNKGLRPLRCFAAILVDINCLTNTPLMERAFFHAVFLLEIEPEFRKNYLVQNYQPQYLICNPQNQSFSELFRPDNAM